MSATNEEWIAALLNTTAEKFFYSLFTSYLKSGQASLLYATTVNDEDITRKTDPKSGLLSEKFICNHEEADTRMIYHASLQRKSGVVFVANDFDVFFIVFLLVLFTQIVIGITITKLPHMLSLQQKQTFMVTMEYIFPYLHSITGCDTLS